MLRGVHFFEDGGEDEKNAEKGVHRIGRYALQLSLVPCRNVMLHLEPIWVVPVDNPHIQRSAHLVIVQALEAGGQHSDDHDGNQVIWYSRDAESMVEVKWDWVRRLFAFHVFRNLSEVIAQIDSWKGVDSFVILLHTE